MKRVIISSTYSSLGSATKVARLEKEVRDWIAHIWFYDPKGPSKVSYDYGQGDKSMRDAVMQDYIDLYTSGKYRGTFSDYVYENRFEIFDESLIPALEKAAKNQDQLDYMIDFYRGLEPVDYNRNLFLKRDGAELKERLM